MRRVRMVAFRFTIGGPEAKELVESHACRQYSYATHALLVFSFGLFILAVELRWFFFALRVHSLTLANSAALPRHAPTACGLASRAHATTSPLTVSPVPGS